MGMDIRGSRGKKTKINAPKFHFLPRLPQMTFPYETWPALKTLVKFFHQENLVFLDFF